jgi:hypothetical protein
VRVRDFQHVLRLHIGADGALTIGATKTETVPRRGRERRGDDRSPSRVLPMDTLRPELIEPPIRVT